MIEYYKVKLRLPNKNVVLWATKRYIQPYYFFTQVDKYGNKDERIRVYMVRKEDIIWEKTAQMNKKYAELEIKRD